MVYCVLALIDGGDFILTGWESRSRTAFLFGLSAFSWACSCVLHLMSINIQGEAVDQRQVAVLSIITAITLLIAIRKLGSYAVRVVFGRAHRLHVDMDALYIQHGSCIHYYSPALGRPRACGVVRGLLADRFRSHFTIVVLSAVLSLGSITWERLAGCAAGDRIACLVGRPCDRADCR